MGVGRPRRGCSLARGAFGDDSDLASGPRGSARRPQMGDGPAGTERHFQLGARTNDGNPAGGEGVGNAGVQIACYLDRSPGSVIVDNAQRIVADERFDALQGIARLGEPGARHAFGLRRIEGD